MGKSNSLSRKSYNILNKLQLFPHSKGPSLESNVRATLEAFTLHTVSRLSLAKMNGHILKSIKGRAEPQTGQLQELCCYCDIFKILLK